MTKIKTIVVCVLIQQLHACPVHLLPLFVQHLFTWSVNCPDSSCPLLVAWLVVAAAGVLMPMVAGRLCSDTCQLLVGVGPQKCCRAPIVFVPCVKPFH